MTIDDDAVSAVLCKAAILCQLNDIDADDAEDVAGEALLRMCRCNTDISRWDCWASVVVERLIVDLWRKSKKYRRLKRIWSIDVHDHEESTYRHAFSRAVSCDGGIGQTDTAMVIEAALRRLPDRGKQIVSKVAVYHADEAATVLGIAYPALKSSVYRARDIFERAGLTL